MATADHVGKWSEMELIKLSWGGWRQLEVVGNGQKWSEMNLNSLLPSCGNPQLSSLINTKLVLRGSLVEDVVLLVL